jgi:hypothetical protein
MTSSFRRQPWTRDDTSPSSSWGIIPKTTNIIICGVLLFGGTRKRTPRSLLHRDSGHRPKRVALNRRFEVVERSSLAVEFSFIHPLVGLRLLVCCFRRVVVSLLLLSLSLSLWGTTWCFETKRAQVRIYLREVHSFYWTGPRRYCQNTKRQQCIEHQVRNPPKGAV